MSYYTTKNTTYRPYSSVADSLHRNGFGMPAEYTTYAHGASPCDAFRSIPRSERRSSGYEYRGREQRRPEATWDDVLPKHTPGYAYVTHRATTRPRSPRPRERERDVRVEEKQRSTRHRPGVTIERNEQRVHSHRERTPERPRSSCHRERTTCYTRSSSRPAAECRTSPRTTTRPVVVVEHDRPEDRYRNRERREAPREGTYRTTEYYHLPSRDHHDRRHSYGHSRRGAENEQHRRSSDHEKYRRGADHEQRPRPSSRQRRKSDVSINWRDALGTFSAAISATTTLYDLGKRFTSPPTTTEPEPPARPPLPPSQGWSTRTDDGYGSGYSRSPSPPRRPSSPPPSPRDSGGYYIYTSPPRREKHVRFEETAGGRPRRRLSSPPQPRRAPSPEVRVRHGDLEEYRNAQVQGRERPRERRSGADRAEKKVRLQVTRPKNLGFSRPRTW